MGASSELPHGGRGGRLGRTRHLRLCRHLRHLEVLTRRARLAAAPTFALTVAAAFLLPGGQGDRLGSFPSAARLGPLAPQAPGAHLRCFACVWWNVPTSLCTLAASVFDFFSRCVFFNYYYYYYYYYYILPLPK